jgi:hypothetical protein
MGGYGRLKQKILIRLSWLTQMSPAALCLSISRRTGSSFSGMGQHISHVLNFEKELLRRAHLQPADGNTDGGTGGLTPRSGAGLFHLT